MNNFISIRPWFIVFPIVKWGENILKIFNGLSSQFRQILLITHVEEMKDMMPVVWNVQEVSEGSSDVTT